MVLDTDEETQRFIDQVKGRKIKAKDWDSMHFIPDGKWKFDAFFNGSTFTGEVVRPGQATKQDWYYIHEGFGTWTLLKKAEVALPKCGCDIQTVMISGCKCGGV